MLDIPQAKEHACMIPIEDQRKIIEEMSSDRTDLSAARRVKSNSQLRI